MLGAEVLMRWNSAELARVLPMRLTPVAEKSGLITVLGRCARPMPPDKFERRA